MKPKVINRRPKGETLHAWRDAWQEKVSYTHYKRYVNECRGAMRRSSQIRMVQLSVFNSPPRPSPMAIIKGWFDDSSNDGVWAVGGYAGADHRWDHFDFHWLIALAKHGVPYFHMKEMASPTGVYAKWHPTRQHADEVKAFLSDLAQIISESRLVSFLSLVRLKDLEAFNKEHNLSIKPYSLCVYGCMIVISTEYGDFSCEMVFDHLEKVKSKLEEARKYASSDLYYAGAFDKIKISPLDKEITFRTVFALQAADFAVWEFRKHHYDKTTEWHDIQNKPLDDAERWEHFINWSQAKYGELTPPPRKSLSALVEGNQIAPFIWDYNRLCEVHRLRGAKWA